MHGDLAGLTSRSEGVGDGDDGGDDGGAGGLLDFCENKNPISYQVIKCICLAYIVLSNFSIQSRSSFPI